MTTYVVAVVSEAAAVAQIAHKPSGPRWQHASLEDCSDNHHVNKQHLCHWETRLIITQ